MPCFHSPTIILGGPGCVCSWTFSSIPWPLSAAMLRPRISLGSQSGFAERGTLRAGAAALEETATRVKRETKHPKANEALIMTLAKEDKSIRGETSHFWSRYSPEQLFKTKVLEQVLILLPWARHFISRASNSSSVKREQSRTFISWVYCEDNMR